MENFESIPQLPSGEEASVPTTNPAIYPPKYQKLDKRSNIWLRSIISLALYLVLGYYFFPSYKILLLITAIVMFHEFGHFFAMKFYKYNDLGIFFIPLLGAYVSGTKREVSQLQSAVILLAGPLPGILLGIVMFMLGQHNPDLEFLEIPFSRIALLLIILNLINLLPIYPLDGGQLLNRVFLDEESMWSKAFIFLSSIAMCWFAWKLKFYALLIFPVMMLLRLLGEKRYNQVERKVEEEGINTDLAYEDLPDADYWRIRNILANEHPGFRDLIAGPPYEYSIREEKVMLTIQNLLHRHLIQDVSFAGKLFILVICVAAFAAPWLLKMDMSFFSRFGF